MRHCDQPWRPASAPTAVIGAFLLRGGDDQPIALDSNRATGSTPGLYGGTQDEQTCDQQQMIDHLTAPAAEAWAEAQDIDGVPWAKRSCGNPLLEPGDRPTTRSTPARRGTASTRTPWPAVEADDAVSTFVLTDPLGKEIRRPVGSGGGSGTTGGTGQAHSRR